MANCDYPGYPVNRCVYCRANVQHPWHADSLLAGTTIEDGETVCAACSTPEAIADRIVAAMELVPLIDEPLTISPLQVVLLGEMKGAA